MRIMSGRLSFIKLYQNISSDILKDIYPCRKFRPRLFTRIYVQLSFLVKLPDDLKKIFDEVAGQAMRYSDDLYLKSEEKIITRLDEEVEIIRPGPEVISKMREKMKPV